MKGTIILTLSILAFVHSTAQIVYTDVNPDQAFRDSGAVYHLDLDNDGISDFDIAYIKRVVTFSGHCFGPHTNYNINITPLQSNLVLSDVNSRSYALSLNDVVSPGSSYWSNTPNQALISASWQCVAPSRGCDVCSNTYHLATSVIGNWSDTSDRYLGLQLVKGNNTYYGWARLSVSSAGFTIKDYAYNSIPNDSVYAGQINNVFAAISSITAPPYCAGSAINVSYLKMGDGTFGAANIFTVQLSDSNRSFANPLNIGSTQSTEGGTINATIPPTTSAGSRYRLRVISSSPSSPVYADNGTDIIIHHGIAAAAISASGPTTICWGDPVTLSTPVIAGYAYQWALNGAAIQDISSSFITVYGDTTENYNYQCVVTNACGLDTTNPLAVIARPLPAPGYIAASGPTTFCKGGNVTLNIEAGAGLSYQWYHNDSGLDSIPGAIGASYIADSTGIYDVKEINQYGCSVFSNNTVSVIVPDMPAVSIQTFTDSVWQVFNDTTICARDSVQLFANVNDNNTNLYQYQYDWSLNGTDIPEAVSNYFFARTSGTYKVKVTDICGSTFSQEVKLTTKQCNAFFRNMKTISESLIARFTNLKVAPNPFSGSTTISFSLLHAQKVVLQIFDVNGGLIRTLADFQMQAGPQQFVWDAKDEKGNVVSAGIYFVKLMTGFYSETQKIILVK